MLRHPPSTFSPSLPAAFRLALHCRVMHDTGVVRNRANVRAAVARGSALVVVVSLCRCVSVCSVCVKPSRRHPRTVSPPAPRRFA